jgi:hypothetical protein
MFEITDFIAGNMYIVVVVLYVLGMFMKRIPSIPDWTIPFVLTVVGVLLGLLILGVPDGILQGVLCAGGAVLVNQMIKQAGDAAGIDKHEK